MTKIATRLKNAVTGEEYYIGTTGAEENVRVELSAPDAVDWTQLQVQVQNISKSTSETYDLDAQGKCTFKIPMGDIYVVVLPIVSGYLQPNEIRNAATMASRVIEYAYMTDSRKELLAISSHVQSITGDTPAMLAGLQIIATDTLGVQYIGYFTAQGTCNTIEIPYGRTYTIAFPNVGGYSHDHMGEEHTAGLPSREIDVRYTEIGIGVFGMDAQGNKYTIEQIAALADKSIIVAGAYNDADLEASPRGDGSYGNGFCWKIGDEVMTQQQWAYANERFDTDRLPFYSDLGDMKFAGKHMTDMIIQIGLEKWPSVPSGSYQTQAATNCNAKRFVIGGVDRDGFLPAYDQIYRIANLNKTAFQAFYAALGLTAPEIWSGNWWTSCQFSGADAVLLNNGGFDRYNKYGRNSVFCCYDL